MFKQIGRIAAFVAVVGGSAAAFAQGGSSTISGTVFDQDKAVLPGVTVTVTNEATGISRDTVTGPEGLFVIPTLLPALIPFARNSPVFRHRRARARPPHRAGGDARPDPGRRRSDGERDGQRRGADHRDHRQPHRRGGVGPGDRPASQPGPQPPVAHAARAGPGPGSDAG